jgi:biopolymer transport protein ExbB
VAIPAYFFHRYFRGRVADYVVEMEQQTILLIDELSAQTEPAAPVRAVR